MDTKKLVVALQSLPEVRLRLITLAWKVVQADGSLDADAIGLHMKELEEAIDEAQAYSDATQELVACMIELVRSKR